MSALLADEGLADLAYLSIEADSQLELVASGRNVNESDELSITARATSIARRPDRRTRKDRAAT